MSSSRCRERGIVVPGLQHIDQRDVGEFLDHQQIQCQQRRDIRERFESSSRRSSHSLGLRRRLFGVLLMRDSPFRVLEEDVGKPWLDSGIAEDGPKGFVCRPVVHAPAAECCPDGVHCRPPELRSDDSGREQRHERCSAVQDIAAFRRYHLDDLTMCRCISKIIVEARETILELDMTIKNGCGWQSKPHAPHSPIEAPRKSANPTARPLESDFPFHPSNMDFT